MEADGGAYFVLWMDLCGAFKKKKKIILSVQSLDKLLKGHLYAERQPFASSSYAIGMFTPSMYQTLARYLAACCFGFPSWPL